MNTIVQVALGGAVGAVLRYGSVVGAVRVLGVSGFYGTMFVNVVGSFVMGLLAVWLLERGNAGRYAPLLMTGVLGGFTTFSAFSLDAVLLWEQGRHSVAAGYVFGSVICAIVALVVGVMVMRSLLA